MEFTEKEILEIKKITDWLEKFREQILNIDYIHNKEDFFKIMKDFRKYLVKISSW